MNKDLDIKMNGIEKQRQREIAGEIAGVMAVGILGVGAIVGITYNNKDNNQKDLVKKDSKKIFDEGEHFISVRIPYELNPNDCTIGVHEGYEVFDITPYTVSTIFGSKTKEYDVWYKNTEEVRVSATYNKELNQYGYYTFGEVVEKEKTLTK